jgi:hypothetical protein
MTHFKNYRPFMAYLSQADIDRIKAYSKKTKVPMAQLVREGVAARISGESMYSDGFNEGITKAITVVHDMPSMQMKFPSGASFAEIIENELVKHMWREPKKEEPNEEAGVI